MAFLETFLDEFLAYFSNTFLPSILEGDPTSIAILGIAVLIFLAVFFKLSEVVYRFVKRFFLFIVVIFSLYFFVLNFGDKIFSEQPDLVIVAAGALGLLIGLIAFVISVFSIHKSYSQVSSSKESKVEMEEVNFDSKPSKKIVTTTAPNVRPSQIQQPDFLTQQFLAGKSFRESIQDDRSLLAVLSYSIIAQFGVFSGVTLSAPTVEVGMIFFAVFFVGAFIFIKTSYHSYSRGVMHLIFAFGFGVILSVLLGHFWATIPLEEMLSINYFTSPSLVALVTGIAVSLLLGSKH